MRLLSKTNLIFVVIFISVVFLIAPLPVKALDIFPSIPDLVGGVIDIMGYALNFIFGLVLILAGKAVDIMLQLNFDILNESNKIVLIGWKITRDLTNLGFVLLSIIIAIATIIRYNEYGARKLLPKLIAVAILVNFSLVIAGSIIQLSNVLTNFFISQATQGRSLSESLGGILNPQKIFSPDPDPTPPDPQGGGYSSLIIRIATVAFNVAFTAIAAITMLAFAFMLLLRYIYLSILLILVPIVCLAYVFPALKEHWSKWMTSFTKWLLFAPALSFFVYIAFVAAEQFRNNETIKAAAISGEFNNIFKIGLEMTILCGILLGGLITAESMGIMGASAGLSAAKSLGTKTKEWSKNVARRSAQATARTVPGQVAARGLQGGGKFLQGIAGDYWKVKPEDRWYKRLGKHAANVTAKATGLSSLAGTTGGVLSGRAKAMQDLAKSPDIKAQYIIGSLMRGAAEAGGLIKKKEEKPEERKSKGEIAEDIKTRENFKENMMRAGYKENSKEVMGAEADIKRLQGEFNRIRENEIRIELSGNVGLIKEKMQDLIDKKNELEGGLVTLQSELTTVNAMPVGAKKEAKLADVNLRIAQQKTKLEPVNFEYRITASVAEQQGKAERERTRLFGKTSQAKPPGERV